VIELPSGVVVFTIIKSSANACFFEQFCQFLALSVNCGDVIILIGNWNKYDLDLSNSRWKYESLIVAMDHDHRAN
jgi:hypothetical protein